MRKEFESHCEDYNLEYDFVHLGDTYANCNTHQAYILFKSLQNTASNSDYAKCTDELFNLSVSRFPSKQTIEAVLKKHFA